MPKTFFDEKRLAPIPKTEKTPAPKKERKVRSDKKMNIKFPLDPKDKKKLAHKAFEHKMSLTAFTSMVIENEIYISERMDNWEYPTGGKLSNVCVSQDDFKEIQKIAIDWDVSKREVVFRYIRRFLARETELEINHYQFGKVIMDRDEVFE